ncbi:Prenylcysteine lyase-domain-containing protein [Mycena floridula]|nr:Prenylcysteine lyase-domain-containing protein [Mycena floridula]
MSKLFLLSLPLVAAFQLPFEVPFLSRFKAQLPLHSPPIEPADLISRIAIIGAGAGGSSAAFWISKAKERAGSLQVEVDVYEKSDYIGGRSTVIYPYPEDPQVQPIELGASIFVKANKNLWRASDEFNLTRNDLKHEDSDFGIWNGQELVFTYSGWWDTVRLFWKYGWSPKRADNRINAMVKSYSRLYAPENLRWENITELAAALGFDDLVKKNALDHFVEHGVSPQFTREFIEAAVRVNYGQNIDEVHALLGSVSMAANSAASIKGGNYQLFERFLEHSGANIYTNTTVQSIIPKSSGSHHWRIESDKGTKNYKAVILALPFHSSGINLPSSLSSQIPVQKYVRLHVTLLTTTSPTMNPAILNLSEKTRVPRMLLTTYDGARNGGKEPEFNSISYHGLVRENEWFVKIFSKERVSDEWLHKAFDQVGWVHRKEWDAYPEAPPTESFAPVRLEKGLYYVNAFEPFISTMETETVASRNVVDLLLNEEFDASICPPKIAASPKPPTLREAFTFLQAEEDFTLGWDC